MSRKYTTVYLAPMMRRARPAFGTYAETIKRDAMRLQHRMFPSRKAVLAYVVVLIVLLPVAGLIYEAYKDGTAAIEFPPPGMMVDIGGRRLHLVCTGEGERTVLFEASGWGTALSAARVRDRLSSLMTVCSYDRSGNGWSDPGPSSASAAELARDLAVLQDRAQLRWPLVIVASSIGGLTAEMFVRQYSERVAGLVLVDAANSELLPTLNAVAGRARTAFCTTSMLARFGVVRLVDPFGLNESEELRRSAALTYSPRPWAQLCAIARGIDRTSQEFKDVPPLSTDLPLTVLSAPTADDLVPPVFHRFTDAKEMQSAAQASHKRMALKSNRGRWQMVSDSTHLIAESQPEAVSDAILVMLETLPR